MFRWHDQNSSAFQFLGGSAGGPMAPEEQERARRNFTGVALVVLCLFGLLFLRLWFLQLVQGNEMQERSEHNRIRVQDLPPWRGMIMDRQGEVLVANRPSYELVVELEDATDIPSLASRLATLLHLDAQQLTAQLTGAKNNDLHLVRVRGDLNWEELARVEAYQPELPGVMVQIQSKREYRHKGQAAHALGYLGEISETQLKNGKFANYKMGDYLGRFGVELAWEQFLRGQRGYRRIETDAYGRELGQMDRVFPSQGANVYLTLDHRLQETAEACLEGKMGAIVVLDPRNGKILAMASAPTFSQEAFERGLTSQEWQKLNRDKTHPLENRAIKGQYPPGSTFKIVMAVAALEEKVTSPNDLIYCNGSLPCANHVFHCWLKGGHGKMNLYRALVESCDIYFYEVGRRLGIDRIAKWSHRFGLGEPSGLNLDKEMPGLVASPAWKKAHFHDSWHEGDTLSVAIGQGYNLATPLQMAQVAAVIANGGTLYEPQLVEKVESQAGEVLFQAKPVVKSRLGASPETIALVQKALVGVVYEKKGTGREAQLPNLEVAGKTGTAQVVALEKEKGPKDKSKTGNHAWFVAYAPASEPRVALAVCLEHAGHGGSAAGPLAKQLLAAACAEPRVAQSK